jgi:tetratricopeptide (TPR) repeat protein
VKQGRARGRRVVASLLLLSGLPALCAAAPEVQHGLTQAPALARVYHDILDARFEQAEQQVRQGCGGAPPIACEILGTVETWWRIQMDPADTSLDAQMRAYLDHAVMDADAWTRREPGRGEAWFYLGAAYAVRVQFRAIRNERLAAARDGKRIKDALERALQLDPSIGDAYFGIGLYHYYADVAPTVFKLLRFLLLLPGGNRTQGLAEMLRARDRGELLRGEADYQLHLLYLWYENQPQQALALLRELHANYPHNPLFLARIAEVEDVYVHDTAASLVSYETLLREARAGRVGMPQLAEVWAQIGIGVQLDAEAEPDRAIDHLKAVVDARLAAPHGALARAALALGKAYDRLGDRPRATEMYRLAIATAAGSEADSVRTAANDQLRRVPDARRAEAYRLSLEGWREFERGAAAHAETLLQRSLDLNAADPVAHFRFGRVLQAGDDARALAQFEMTIAARPPAPAPILASAYFEAGRVLESRGDRARALEMYQSVGRVAGAEARTRDAAAKSLARLRGPSTPAHHR